MVGSDFQLINCLVLGHRLEFITLYLVCVINDVINYSADRTVLMILNLNEYRMPTSIVSVLTLYIRRQNKSFRD